MIARLKRFLSGWRQRRRLARELHPERFREMVLELTELAGMAEQVFQDTAEQAINMDRVRREMEELSRHLENPAFRHLPVERRRELKDGLDRSREAVLQALQSSSPPTAYLQ